MPDYASPYGPFPGQRQIGNIDLEHRPQVKMPDGSIATVYSGTFQLGNKWVLLPLVSDDGRIVHGSEAVRNFQQTGKHLGIFDSADDAEIYAQQLHKAQERYYIQNQLQGLRR